jgi:3-oxoacyl-[acyl-carrier-protein] synthase III
VTSALPRSHASATVLPVRVAGLGSALPSRVVTNDELATVLDTSDAWIRSRTGIAQRHVAAPDEAPSDLAAAAGKAALADAGLGVEDVTTVLVATTSPDHKVPGTAPMVAAALGTEVSAFDVNAACSGFVTGLRVGGALAATGDGAVLVIGAETMTRIVDPADRAVRVLFGDGAGAAVLVGDPRASFGPFDLGSDGADPSMLWCPAGGTRTPIAPGSAEGDPYLRMRGGDIYRHAVTRMVASSRAVLDAAGLEVADVDLLVGHQANARILDAVVQRLGIDPSRSHVTVDAHANTSAASVPLALADARDRGRLIPGATVLLTAFGAGLTWASCLLTWGGSGAGERTVPTDLATDPDDDPARDLLLRTIEEDA